MAHAVITSGKNVVREKTSLVDMFSRREPEKYALATPPTAALPQHSD